MGRNDDDQLRHRRRGVVGQVYVSINGGPEKTFATASGGSQDAEWIWRGSTYEFRSYAGNNREQLLRTISVSRANEVATGSGRCRQSCRWCSSARARRRARVEAASGAAAPGGVRGRHDGARDLACRHHSAAGHGAAAAPR